MRVRTAIPEEFDAVGELTVDAYQAIFDEPLGAYAHELRDAATRAADSDLLVAVDDDGTLLGTVTYVAGPGRAMSEFDHDDAAGIRMLAVDPSRQGNGAGRALVEACVSRARDSGRARIVLHSTPQMVIAQGLYARLGFVRVDSRDVVVDDESPYTPEDPLVLMAFELAL